MKKEPKIRSPFVKQLVEDRETLENIIKDTTKSSLSTVLEETVKNQLNNLLKEDDDKEYEEDEVEDTKLPSETDDQDVVDTDTDSDVETPEDDGAEDTDNMDGAESQETDDTELGSDTEDDGWGEFEKYKGDDDTYDFRNADNDTIVKVYKLLKDDDQVFVEKDEEGNTHITDNETGNEYMIVDDSAEEESGEDFGDDMSEQRIYEIALNDDDCEDEEFCDDEMDEANLGYTTDYQRETAMTTPGNQEPANPKSTYSMDAGVPTGTEKPWVGNAGDMKPFKESAEKEEDEENMEEGTNVGGFVQQNSTSKSHVPNSSGRSARNASVAGVHVKSTSQPRYSNVSEDIKRKANAIWQENKELKKELLNIKNLLQEAVVLNFNLGQITKLFTENTTSKKEKIDIVKRFGSEAKTIEDSKKLYESISKELKKVKTIDNVKTIDKPLAENKKSEKPLMETTIYQSDELTESLDLIKRMSKM